jgi:CheY-like chemotaxis protein
MAAQPTSKHVLVVNDSEEVVELFRDILEGLGHRTSATTYAPEDLAEVKKVSPDLVILDLMINGEAAGWQLAQKLRMTRATQGIPLIICTAATDNVREQEGWLAANNIKVVFKPFAVDDLELAVTKALKLPELTVRPESADGDGSRPSQPERSH